MSRKPTTPTDDTGPAGAGAGLKTIEAGYRVSGNEELLRIEAELVAEGVDLPNRAIPADAHAISNDYDAASIRARIEEETEREYPNRQLIGYLNELYEQY